MGKFTEYKLKRQADTNSATKYRQFRERKIENQASRYIVEQLKNYENSNSKFVQSYNDRFFDSDGKYISDKYRRNTQVELLFANKEKERLEKQRQELISLLDSYGSNFKEDWLQETQNYLNDAGNVYDKIIKTYSDDNDLFSQFENADEFYDWSEKQKQKETLRNTNLNSVKTEISDLTNALNNILSIEGQKSLLANQYDNLMYSSNQYPSAEGQTELNAIKAELDAFDKKQKELEGVFGSSSDIKKKLEELNKTYSSAKELQETEALTTDALNASDFEKFAQKGSEWGNDTNFEFYGKDEGRGTYGFFNREKNDLISYYRNNLSSYEDEAKHMVNGPTKEMEKAYHFAKEMTEDEYNIYAYYLGKGDTDSAQKYLDSIEQSITYRFAEDFYDKNLKDANYLEQIVFALTAGTEQFQTGLENLFSNSSEFAPSYRQVASEKVREDLKDKSFNVWYNFKTGEWEDKINGNSIGQIGYDLASTTGNMLPSILTSAAVSYINPVAGQMVGSALMGASAKGNAYAEMINLGYNPEQASRYSTLVGASEAGLQFLLGGIGKLGGSVSSKAISSAVSKIDNVFVRTAIQLGGNMLSEGTEEYIQEVLDPFFKNIAFGEDNDIRFISEDALYSGLLGALSAGVLEGGSTISSNVSTYRTGKQLKAAGVTAEQLSELGSKLSINSEAYKLAGRINENTGAYTIGRMFNELNAEITAQNKAEIKEALRAKGINPVSANSIANWMERVVAGEELTAKQKAALENNPVLGEVMRDVLYERNTTALQRQAGLDSIRSQLEEYQIKQALDKAVKKAEKKKAKNTANNTADTQDTQNTAQQAETEDFEAETDTSLAESEKANEANPRVSDNGRTFSTKTGEDLDIVGIASVKDKTFKTADGQTVDSKDVSFATENEAVLFDSVLSMDLPTEIANAIIDGYIPSDNISVTDYLLGSNLAYRYGYAGAKDIELMLDTDVRNIPEHLSKGLYNLGRETAKAEISKEQAKTDEKKAQKSENKAKKKGSVTFDGKELSKEFEDSLTDIQRESIKGIKVIAEVLGNDVNLFASYIAKEGPYKGKRVYKDSNGNVKLAPNGFYNPDGSINLDINSGNLGEGTILYTLSHELTHHIRKWSPAKFKVLADFVVEQYSDNGIKINDLVYEQMAKAKKNGRSISYGTAYEEVIADACSTMLLDSNAIEKLAQKDKTLFEKIKSFIKDFIDKINNLYKNFSPDAKEAQHVKDIKGMTDKLQALWFEALEDAGDTYSAVHNKKGIGVGEQKMSVREFDWNSEGGQLIASTMSMETCKQMIERAYRIVNPNQYEETPIYRNADQWLADVGADEVALYIENEYMLQEKYLDKIPAYLDGDVYVSEIIEAYQAGVLKGSNNKEEAKRLNVSEGIDYTDGRFYAPQKIEGVKELYETANQKLTKVNKKEVTEARAKILLFAHNRGAVEKLGITQSELNKKLRSWANYSAKARDISARVNNNVAMSNMWTGIENSSYLYNATVSEDDFLNLVGDISGSSSEYERRFIASTMLALDTHIDYTGIKFKFGENNFERGSVLGDYNDSSRTIRIRRGSGLNTVSHEMGHAIDHQWERDVWEWSGRESRSSNNGLSLGYVNLSLITDPEVNQWIKNFQVFVDNISDSSSITSQYAQSKNEVFARFVAWFTEQTMQIATGRMQNYGHYIAARADKFTYNHYIEFVKILQEKAKLDAKHQKANQEEVKSRGLSYVAFSSEQVKDIDNKAPTSDPDIRFSDRSFSEQIDDVLDGADTTSTHLKVMDTPSILQEAGLPNLPILMTTKHLKSITASSGKKKVNYHGLDVDIVKKLPKYISEPVMIADSLTRDDSIVVITEAVDSKKRPVLAAILLDGAGRIDSKHINANIMTSAYGKDNFNSFLKRIADNDALVYWNKKKSQALSVSLGLQLPNAITSLNSDTIIRKAKAFDKKKIGSQQKNLSDTDIRYSDREPDFRFSDRDSVDSLLERRTSIQSKLNELRKTRKELESSDEYNNLISDVFFAETETEKTKSINEYKSWIAKNKYDEIVGEIESLQKEHSEINRIISERVKQKAIEDERKKIAESGLSDADYFRKSAIKEFGYTPYFYDAGYMLPNGKLLNFSGEKGKHFGSRGQDHRAIETVYADVSRGKAMLKFMSEGNIRVMAETPGLDISSVAEPTSEQYTVIKKFVREYAKEKYLAVDITDENGNVIGTYGYGNNINADRVVNDIKYYFQNGAIREQSSVSRFFYSERDPDGGFSKRYLLANALESTAKTAEDKKKLVEYKAKLGKLSEVQQRLQAVNAKIKEISFGKGKRDKVKLAELQKTSKELNDLINRYDKKLFSLESTESLKQVLEREKKAAYKKAAQEGKEALTDYREKAKQREQDIRSKYQESRQKSIEGREKTAMRHKIQKVIMELDGMLRHGTKEKNVKVGLQKVVADAVQAINADTVKLEALRKAYADIRYGKSEDVPAYYMEEAAKIEQKIDEVIDLVGDTPMSKMSLEQLNSVYDMYRMVLTTVRNVNKVFRENKLEDLRVNAEAVMVEESRLPKLKEERSKATETVRKYMWNEMIPVYAFETLGSNTLKKFFWDTVEAQNVFARDVDEANAVAKNARKKYGYKSWDRSKIYEFTLEDGKVLRMNLEHMMSVYAYSKRKQAISHMTTGGFFFNDDATFRKKGGVISLISSQEEGYKVSAETLAKIKDKMSEVAKGSIEYVDEMQSYLTDMGEKGNEVSRVIWGIDIFKEKVYFPLKSVKDFVFQTNQPTQETSLKNDGMTKETKPNASNPIVLDSFDDIWASHVNRMSQYHAFVIPIDNLNKVYNYGTWLGDSSKSVSTIIGSRHGKAANEYLTQFIQDLNGGISVKGASNPLMNMFGKFKKTAVAASTSVVVQQPTAIIRATAMIDPKYFVGKPNVHMLKQYEQLKKYAPIAIIKEIGGFDAGAGRQATNWLNDDTKQGIDKALQKIDDISMLGAAWGDILGWCTIWDAVKREVKANNRGIDVNSEEFLNLAGKRFTEVIVYTQVYDSTLSRSGYMRSKHDSVKMLTAFMGEPTVSINMMYNAVLQAKRGGKGARIKAARTIGAVYLSTIAASAAASAIYALRDDDEDETYIEKFAEAWSDKMLGKYGLTGELNPLTQLPAVKDIISIFEGWDVERTDIAVIKDIKDAFDGLFSGNKSTWRKIEDFSGAIASLFGLPVKNILRTGREMYNAVNAIFSDVEGGSFGEAFVRGVTGEEKSKPNKLYDAIVNGDEEMLKMLREGYDDDAAYETAVKKALRENDPRIKEAAEAGYNGDVAERVRIAKEIIAEGNFSQDIVVEAINAEVNFVSNKIKEAAKAESKGDRDEKKDITEELINEHNFSEKDIVNAIKKELDSEEDETEDAEEKKSIYSTKDITTALEDGDATLAKEIIADIVSVKVENYMAKDEDLKQKEAEKKAKTSVKSSLSEYWKKLYIEAYNAKDTDEMRRIRFVLKDTGLYGTANDIISTCNNWVKESRKK